MYTRVHTYVHIYKYLNICSMYIHVCTIYVGTYIHIYIHTCSVKNKDVKVVGQMSEHFEFGLDIVRMDLHVAYV